MFPVRCRRPDTSGRRVSLEFPNVILGLTRLGALLAVGASGLFASTLTRTTDADSGATVYSLSGPVDASWQYQWYVDDQPITLSGVRFASALIVYPDHPLTANVVRVMILKDGGASENVSLALNGANGASSGSGTTNTATPATSGTTPVTTPSSTFVSGVRAGWDNFQSPTSVENAGTNDRGLVNLSARGQVGPGKPLIVGFVLRGTVAKPILVREVGPGLTAFGVTDALADPNLSVYSGSTVVLSNDDWWTNEPGTGLAAAMQRVGAFPLTSESHDSCVAAEFQPGAYTAIAGSSNSGTGSALVEFYDGDLVPTESRLINISARGFAGNGKDVLIVGFVVGGSEPCRVLIRAAGPALSQFGVNAVLANPRATLYSGQTVLAENDDWNVTDVQAAQTDAGAFAFEVGSKDAALVTTLNPGAYTVVVRGSDATVMSGETLVEVYEVP